MSFRDPCAVARGIKGTLLLLFMTEWINDDGTYMYGQVNEAVSCRRAVKGSCFPVPHRPRHLHIMLTQMDRWIDGLQMHPQSSMHICV